MAEYTYHVEMYRMYRVYPTIIQSQAVASPNDLFNKIKSNQILKNKIKKITFKKEW